MLAVKLLGQFDVRRDETPIVIPARAAQSLLAYLLLTVGTAHRREELAGLLWPDATDENARSSLRHELWRLRKAIETKKPSPRAVPYLLIDEISIGFNPQSHYWLDVAIVQEAATKKGSADKLIEALSLYRGELLPGLYEDWAVLERERVRAIFEQKMARLLELLTEEKRWQVISDWGERWISFGQSPEPAYRALMLAYSAKGDKAKVASIYQRCVTALREDLGVEPSAVTQTLFEELSKGERRITPPETPSPAIKPQAPAQPASGSNLPVPLTSFIGREKELKEIARLLSSSRLLTLTGPGGVGKTRTAIQAANDSIQRFKDGVWWVDLAPLLDEALVPQAVAHVLDVRESPSQPLTESLKIFLRERQALLVLDNCEHLIRACAQLAELLLSYCASLRILATSREALGITGEVLYQVPTLSLPLPQPPTQTDLLMEYEGIRLFVERAGAVKSDFTLTELNASAVLQICRRLEGIPLALELAAARAKLLTVERIAERLDDRFELLTQGSRTALPRQQTLRAVMDWSYGLLLNKERILFRRLAVFAGGWTLEAGQEICCRDDIGAEEFFDLMTQLVNKSLVIFQEHDGVARYRMLETVRQYALNQLIASRETEELRGRHLKYFTEVAEMPEPKFKGTGQTSWLKRLESEHDNLRAALEWGQYQTGGVEMGLRLCGALGRFWEKQNALTEGREWLGKFLKLSSSSSDTAAFMKALSGAAKLAYLQSDYGSAITQLDRLLTIAELQNDIGAIADAQMELGKAWWRRGDYDRASHYFEQAIQRAEAMGDTILLARAHGNLGLVWTEHGDMDRAIVSARASLDAFLRAGLPEYIGIPNLNLGRIYHLRGEFDRASACYLDSIKAFESVSDEYNLSIAFNNLAELNLDQRNYPEAIAFVQKSTKIAEASGNKWTLSVSHRIMAGISLEQGQTDLALSHVERALQGAAQSEDQLALLHFRRAEIHAARGETSQADKDFETARDILERLQKKSELARLYRAYGLFLGAQAESQQNGRDYVQKAISLFRELGSVKEVEDTTQILQKLAWPGKP